MPISNVSKAIVLLLLGSLVPDIAREILYPLAIVLCIVLAFVEAARWWIARRLRHLGSHIV